MNRPAIHVEFSLSIDIGSLPELMTEAQIDALMRGIWQVIAAGGSRELDADVEPNPTPDEMAT